MRAGDQTLTIITENCFADKKKLHVMKIQTYTLEMQHAYLLKHNLDKDIKTNYLSQKGYPFVRIFLWKWSNFFPKSQIFTLCKSQYCKMKEAHFKTSYHIHYPYKTYKILIV